MNRTLKQIGAVALAVGMTTFAATSADAAVMTDLGWNDNDFWASPHDGNIISTAEIRAETQGNWEFGLWNGDSLGAQGDHTWNGFANFSLSYDADDTKLSLTLGGTAIDSFVDLGSAQTMFLRLRSDEEKNNQPNAQVSVKDLTLSGASLAGGTIESPLPHDPNSYYSNYWMISGFDIAADWTLAGQVKIADAVNQDSHTAMNVKISDVPPVPLPAAAWFMLTALGGLVGSRWLKGRTADQAA
ncbi:VPLPA-CTERM sorting domain-containing protein [uncultured Rhodospira sp.]|uniref:VPLPA-CTERM sorting domain-containing protein n=1 Tax=uncultured Rhodospira sp. TaxID=1936189 RepID=UPI00260CEE82|nr:VPLPA-CTERM sorting domain-containing protein [uncultured Rhodospira sp.]